MPVETEPRPFTGTKNKISAVYAPSHPNIVSSCRLDSGLQQKERNRPSLIGYPEGIREAAEICLVTHSGVLAVRYEGHAGCSWNAARRLVSDSASAMRYASRAFGKGKCQVMSTRHGPVRRRKSSRSCAKSSRRKSRDGGQDHVAPNWESPCWVMWKGQRQSSDPPTVRSLLDARDKHVFEASAKQELLGRRENRIPRETSGGTSIATTGVRIG